ncbi:hypothetical protein [Metabacillus sp. 22489]|uniref:hypothetical protein n=1 Tax=Metabacillus sp. 22489 TaxID=3453928 RepID=UPI003F84EDB9
MMNNKDYLTNAPKQEKIILQTDGSSPNKRNIDGNSVLEHKNLEVANSYIASKEIGQQRENL